MAVCQIFRNFAAEFLNSTARMGFTSVKSEFSALGLHHPCHPLKARMSNGVMVAQQVLVLFVVVRIRLGQQR